MFNLHFFIVFIASAYTVNLVGAPPFCVVTTADHITHNLSREDFDTLCLKSQLVGELAEKMAKITPRQLLLPMIDGSTFSQVLRLLCKPELAQNAITALTDAAVGSLAAAVFHLNVGKDTPLHQCFLTVVNQRTDQHADFLVTANIKEAEVIKWLARNSPAISAAVNRDMVRTVMPVSATPAKEIRHTSPDKSITAVDRLLGKDWCVFLYDAQNHQVGAPTTGEFKTFASDGSVAIIECKIEGAQYTLLLDTKIGIPRGKPVRGEWRVFSPSGTIAVITDTKAWPYQYSLCNVKTGLPICPSISGSLSSFSSDGAIVTFEHSSNNSWLYSTTTGAQIRGPLDGEVVALSHNGALAVLSNYGRPLYSTRLFDVAANRQIGPVIEGKFESFSPDESIIAVRTKTDDEPQVTLYNSVTGGSMSGPLSGYDIKFDEKIGDTFAIRSRTGTQIYRVSNLISHQNLLVLLATRGAVIPKDQEEMWVDDFRALTPELQKFVYERTGRFGGFIGACSAADGEHRIQILDSNALAQLLHRKPPVIAPAGVSVETQIGTLARVDAATQTDVTAELSTVDRGTAAVEPRAPVYTSPHSRSGCLWTCLRRKPAESGRVAHVGWV